MGDTPTIDQYKLLEINEKMKMVSISEKNNGSKFHYPYYPNHDYKKTK